MHFSYMNPSGGDAIRTCDICNEPTSTQHQDVRRRCDACDAMCCPNCIAEDDDSVWRCTECQETYQLAQQAIHTGSTQDLAALRKRIFGRKT